MGYLLVKLWYWVLVAFAIGVLTGWLACSPADDDRR
jgi:Na+/H+-dicarboxylate symporter